MWRKAILRPLGGKPHWSLGCFSFEDSACLADGDGRKVQGPVLVVKLSNVVIEPVVSQFLVAKKMWPKGNHELDWKGQLPRYGMVRKDMDTGEITRHGHNDRVAMPMLSRTDRMADNPPEASQPEPKPAARLSPAANLLERLFSVPRGL